MMQSLNVGLSISQKFERLVLKVVFIWIAVCWVLLIDSSNRVLVLVHEVVVVQDLMMLSAR